MIWGEYECNLSRNGVLGYQLQSRAPALPVVLLLLALMGKYLRCYVVPYLIQQ